MPIDASILLQGKAPQFDNPLDVANKAMNMKQMMQQSRIADQQEQESNAIKNAYKKGVVAGPDGKMTVDREVTLNEMMQHSPQQAEAQRQAWSKQDLEEQDRQMMVKTKQTEQFKKYAFMMNPSNYQQIRQQMIDEKLPNAQNLPPGYDENFMQQSRESLHSADVQNQNYWKQKEYEQKERELRKKKDVDPVVAELREQRLHDMRRRGDEAREEINTPYGEARTKDDAKKLKEAHEAKEEFDRKLSEMISLREKHEGGAIFNRDDVGRGKQLSKDLLLAYKDMAKLGVLSKSDENILNTIIPADPLQFNSPVASLQGQDPTLHRLKKFKQDAQADFQTRLQTRLRNSSLASDNPNPSAPQVPGLEIKPSNEAHASKPQVLKTDQIDWAE